jgi:hypothetical protein
MCKNERKDRHLNTGVVNDNEYDDEDVKGYPVKV